MWTLFLIITLSADPSSPDNIMLEKSIMGGISSHEIGFFRKEEDCIAEAMILTSMLKGSNDYIIEYRCFPTRSEPE